MTPPPTAPSAYSLRPACLADIAGIQEVQRAGGALFKDTPHAFVADHEPDTAEELSVFITGGISYVATQNDQVAACALAGVLDRALHLYQVDTHPQHARRGLGAALIERLCADAQAMGLSAMTLSTFTNVAWNAPYYARLGFQVLPDSALTPGLYRIRTKETAEGLVDRCLMRRDLGAHPADQARFAAMEQPL